MQEKIVLGTVQLGISYGINNSFGKPSEGEAFKILDLAYRQGVKILDSADAYGESLSVIGKYHKSTGNYFDVISKFKINNTSLTEKLESCLDMTGLSFLYSYMYHDFSDYESGLAANQLMEFKKQNIIRKLGVSLYSVEQLKKAVHDSSIDLIQLPINLLDLSREKVELLRLAKSLGKELHARSVFLQGIFMRDPESLTGNLISLKPYLIKLNSLSKQVNLEVKRIAINFVLHQECIDHIILGVERVEQLQENLSLLENDFNFHPFYGLEVDNRDVYLLNPANWKP